MRKLCLNLDELEVASFEASDRSTPLRGTVEGHVPPASYYATCEDATCEGSCDANSCFMSCIWGNCTNTGNDVC